MSVEGDRRGDSEKFAGACDGEDIAVTTEGLIAVLTRQAIHLVDRDGKHRRTIDLARSWARSHLCVGHFGRPRRRVRRARFPREVADRPNEGGRNVAIGSAAEARERPVLSTLRCGVAPDGTLWVSDSHALYRLNEKGIVDRVRKPPRPEASIGGRGHDRFQGPNLRRRGAHGIGSRLRPRRTLAPRLPPGSWRRPQELLMPRLTVSEAGATLTSASASS